MKRFSVRALIFPLVFLSILVLAVLSVALCLRAGQVPASLVNSGLVPRLLNRYGVQYSIASLNIGCFQADCGAQVDASGLELTLPELGEFHASFDALHWCPVHPVSIRGLSAAGVHVSDLKIDAAALTAQAQDIRFAEASLRQVTTSPALLSADGERLSFESIDIEGLNVVQPESPAEGNLCARAESWFVARDNLTATVQRSREGLDRMIGRVRGDLIGVFLILAAALFGVKVLVTTWIKRPLIRLALCAGSIAVPVLVYSLSGRVGLTFAASLLFGVAAWVFHYRQASRIYQRWEPFILDVIGVALVFPLLAVQALDARPAIQGPSNIDIGSVNVTDAAFSGIAERCSEGHPIAVQLAGLTIEGVGVALPGPADDITAIQIRSVQLPGADIDTTDIAVSNLRAAIEEFRFAVDGATRRIQTLEVGLQANGVVNIPAIGVIDFSVTDGAIAFDPQACAFKYAASTQVLARSTRANVTLTGDPETIRLQSIRLLPGSPLQVGGGSGTLTFGKTLLADLHLSKLEAGVDTTKVNVATAGITIDAPLPCSNGPQTFRAVATNAEVRAINGTTASIGQFAAAFRRNTAGAISADTLIQDTRFSVPSSQITGSIPELQFNVAGTTTGGQVPRSFDGSALFSVGRTDEAFLSNRTPLKFSADFREGVLNIPLQNQSIHQALVTGGPTDIAFEVAFNSRFASREFDAVVHVPQLSLPLGSLRADLNDLRLAATGQSVNFTSGWNTLSLPAVPAAFCLDRISRVVLSSTGSATGLMPPEDRAAGLQVQPCLDIPSLPSRERFRIEAALPGLRLHRESGGGIQIRKLSSRIRSLDLAEARLQSIELDSGVFGIQSLNGGPESSVQTRLAISADGVKASSSLLGEGTELLTWALDSKPGHINLELSQIGSANQLLAAAGVKLNGITPMGRVSRLAADAWFEGGALARFNANVSLAAGPLAAIDGAELSTGESAIEVGVEGGTLSFRARMPGLAFSRRTDGRPLVSLTADLETEAHGSFHREKPAPNPVLTAAGKTIRDLRQHLTKAAGVFGSPSTIEWDVLIQNPTESESLFSVNGADIGFAFDADVKRFAWGADARRLSTVSGAAGLSGDLKIHDGFLVADAYAPLNLTTSGIGLPPKLDFRLPLLVAFSDALRPATEGNRLWNRDYYANFWSGYRPGQSSRGTVALVNDSRVVAGPVSIRGIFAPTERLRIAVGHSGRLGLHAPFGARLLFGTAAGALDVALEWPQDRLSVESTLDLALRNLQAGAVGLDSGTGHLPLLEHELDGDVSVKVSGWPIRLDETNFDIDIRTSSRNGSLPGMFQLRNDVNVNVLNNVLNAIIKDIQLNIPPSSLVFNNLSLKVNANKGTVRTDKPWFKLEGIRIPSSDKLDLEGNIRLFGARNGETLELRNLLENFQILRPQD